MNCDLSCHVIFKRSSSSLIVKCRISGFEPDISFNENCRAKAIYWLGRVKGVSKLVLKAKDVVRVYRGDPLQVMASYSIALAKARNKILDANVLMGCHDTYTGCFLAKRSFLRELLALHPRPGLLYSNPLEAIAKLMDEVKSLRRTEAKGECRSCLINYLSALKYLKDKLRSTELVRLGFKIASDGNFARAYIRLLEPAETIVYGRGEETYKERLKTTLSVDEYVSPPFRIRIYSLNDVELLYAPILDVEPRAKLLIDELASRLRQSKSYLSPYSKNRLSTLLEIREKEALKLLKSDWMESLEERVLRNLALIAAFKSMGLLRIAPFLVDDKVDEFFLDKPGSYIYLLHAEWGRCRSTVRLSEVDVERIITHLKIESGLPLSYENPSLKHEIVTPLFHVRASVDIPPLAVDGPSLDFRKLRKKVWLISSLIRNNTLTAEVAAYMIFCLFRRRNITVIGEPTTGKTTLINALDLSTPRHWRKVYVEDVTESLSQHHMGRRQVRLKVSPLESRKPMSTKSLEALKLLHRSPDIVILSELQTPEHSKAFFQALSSGLRGLQTCHGSSIEGALRRWSLHHGISIASLLELDLMVEMRRLFIDGKEVKRLTRLAEVSLSQGVEVEGVKPVKLVEVFKWDPYSRSLLKVHDLYETPTVLKIREFEYLPRARFEAELKEYIEVLEELSTIDVSTERYSSILNELYLKYVVKGQVTNHDYQALYSLYN